MTGESGLGAMAGTALSSLVCGCVLAITAVAAAAMAGISVQWVSYSDTGDINTLTLFTGVMITGWLLWWVLMARSAQIGALHGGVTGLLVGCLSYPVVLFLAEFFQPDWQSRSNAPSLLERLEHVLALSGFGLATTGFAATITLALAGIVVGAAQRRLMGGRAQSKARSPNLAGRVFRTLAFGATTVVVLLLSSFVGLSLLPVNGLAPQEAFIPAANYAQAVAGFASVRQLEGGMALHPRCGSKLLTHGEKVERVVVFFHGLTNCPAQADELAPFLFAQGYNVLVPLLPGHGREDSLTLALADVTAEDLVATAESSIALAHGLGDEVIVMGLSAGGTMAAYQAQHNATINTAVAVAPFFAPSIVPQWAVRAATNLLLRMPNQMVWWDPRAPYSSHEMDYAYPRFATHALAQIMRLGDIVSAEAGADAPSTPHIGFLLNEADLAVNNIASKRVAAAWDRHGHAVDVKILPRSKRLPHDLIDPRQADAAVDIVYPILAKMMSPDSP